MATTKTTKIAKTILENKRQGTSFPTSVHRLVQNEAVDVEFLCERDEYEGSFELCGGRPTIFVNLRGGDIDDPRVRFTFAHEVGHFFLHRQMLRRGRPFHDKEFLFGAELEEAEREANEFAAEALLPSRLVDQRLKNRVLGLDLIKKLSEEAKASLPATAIKISTLTASRCSFFWEGDGQIVWSAPSDDWKEARFKWSTWKGHLPPESHAANTPGTFEEREVALQAWSPNSWERDEPLFESALQTAYGRLILVLDSSTEEFL